MLVWHSLKHWWGCLESVRTSWLTKKSLRLLYCQLFPSFKSKNWIRFYWGANHFILPKFCIEIMTLLQMWHISPLWLIIINNKCIPFIPSMPVDRDKTSKYRIKLDIILEGNIEVSLIPKSEDILKANSLTQKEAEIVAWRTLNRLLARNKQSEQYLAPTGAQRVLSGLSHVSSSSLFKLSKIR